MGKIKDTLDNTMRKAAVYDIINAKPDLTGYELYRAFLNDSQSKGLYHLMTWAKWNKEWIMSLGKAEHRKPTHLDLERLEANKYSSVPND